MDDRWASDTASGQPPGVARFRELRGIGPAKEAQLHEAGVWEWHTFSAIVDVLANVRGVSTTTLRDLVREASARAAEVESVSASAPGATEHTDAFVVRVATSDGTALRSSAAHARSGETAAWAGWLPARLVAFVESHVGVAERSSMQVARAAEDGEAAIAHVPSEALVKRSVFPIGKTIAGTRDVRVRVTATGGDDATVSDYVATLLARPYGQGETQAIPVAAEEGTWDPALRLDLRFADVELSGHGIYALDLTLTLEAEETFSVEPELQPV